MKHITCPDCEGEKMITEVQSVRLIGREIVGYDADGSPRFKERDPGTTIEIKCKRCRGKGEVPDISCEDRRRAINIVDVWAVKVMDGMGEVPETDTLIEAVAIALVEERERGQKIENEAWEMVCQKAIAEWEGHRIQASLIKRNESAENYLRGACDGVGGVRRERLKQVRAQT